MPTTTTTPAPTGDHLARPLPEPTAFEHAADLLREAAELERDAARTTSWLLVQLVANWRVLNK